MDIVAARLKKLRTGAQLSQSGLAELAGLTQSSVNRYENDQSEPAYRVLLWYADYFDVSLDYIFGRTDKPQGKLFEYKPKMANENVEQFIEMCFDPSSPMNEKLKATLLKMMSGDVNDTKKYF